MAALTRTLDADDAPLSAWVRADPAYVRPDINGAHLLACGEALQLDVRDVAALLPALRPLFGDAGFPLDAPDPHRWYLRLPRGARLPRFVPPPMRWVPTCSTSCRAVTAKRVRKAGAGARC